MIGVEAISLLCSTFILILVVSCLVNEHEISMVQVVLHSCVFCGRTVLILTDPIFDPVEHCTSVGVAATTPWIWSLLCPKVVFAVSGALIDLLEDLVGSLLGLAVVRFQLKDFVRAENLRTKLYGVTFNDDVKGLVTTSMLMRCG